MAYGCNGTFLVQNGAMFNEGCNMFCPLTCPLDCVVALGSFPFAVLAFMCEPCIGKEALPKTLYWRALNCCVSQLGNSCYNCACVDCWCSAVTDATWEELGTPVSGTFGEYQMVHAPISPELATTHQIKCCGFGRSSLCGNGAPGVYRCMFCSHTSLRYTKDGGEACRGFPANEPGHPVRVHGRWSCCGEPNGSSAGCRLVDQYLPTGDTISLKSPIFFKPADTTESLEPVQSAPSEELEQL